MKALWTLPLIKILPEKVYVDAVESSASTVMPTDINTG